MTLTVDHLQRESYVQTVQISTSFMLFLIRIRIAREAI